MDAKDQLVAYEWSEQDVRSLAADPAAIRVALRALSVATGQPLGFTLRRIAAVTEVGVSGKPGWHVFVPTADRPKGEAAAAIITNLDVGRGSDGKDTGGEVVMPCEMYVVTHCVSDASTGYSHESSYEQRHG